MPKDIKSLEHIVTYFDEIESIDEVVPFHRKTDVTALQKILVIGFDETIETGIKKFSMKWLPKDIDALNYVVSVVHLTQSISEVEPAPHATPEGRQAIKDKIKKAEFEISQLARELRNEGKADSAAKSWELARRERSDLDAILNGDDLRAGMRNDD